MVDHRDDHIVASSLPPHFRRTASVDLHVLKHSVQDGLQPDTVRRGFERFAREKGQPVAVGAFAPVRRGPADIGDVERHALQGHRAALRSCQQQEPLREARQVVNLGQDVAAQLGIVFGQDLHPRADEGQRGAQLVGRICREPRLRFVSPFYRPHGSSGQPPTGAHAGEHRHPASDQQQQADFVDEPVFGGRRTPGRDPRNGSVSDRRRDRDDAYPLAFHIEVRDLLGISLQPGGDLGGLADDLAAGRLVNGNNGARRRGDVGVGWGDGLARLADPAHLA